MYCQKCGSQMEGGAKFCPSCGAPTQNNSQSNYNPNIYVNNTNTNINDFGYTYKNKWVTFFLCLFLGCIGAHRFYVGKIGTGVLYLLTLGLFGFGALVDLIIILIGSFTDKAGFPLK